MGEGTCFITNIPRIFCGYARNSLSELRILSFYVMRHVQFNLLCSHNQEGDHANGRSDLIGMHFKQVMGADVSPNKVHYGNVF